MSSTNEWDKDDVVYVYTVNIAQPLKRMRVLFATISIDLKGIMLNGVSQTEKDRYCVVTYMWNLKNKQI